MRIAFYAPMKAPAYPTRSGDRQIARSILEALNTAGHEIHVASSLRSRDGGGELRRQQRIRALGARLAGRCFYRPGGRLLTYPPNYEVHYSPNR